MLVVMFAAITQTEECLHDRAMATAAAVSAMKVLKKK
jgi:hypothetical protein